MTESSKITPDHLNRNAVVYVRQSTPGQLLNNTESTARQYQLTSLAIALGWRRDQVHVIDEDLGLSGDGTVDRAGFDQITKDVGLGLVGIVLGLEVSRLTRNNSDLYRLLDLCGAKDTLIGDTDGIYHPGLFNDRLVLGLKGTMSEAELHVLRARLDGGIRNKALRGELIRGLPIGFVSGEADGEIMLHPDESVRAAIRSVFDLFAEMGSVRRVWKWFHSEALRFPHYSNSRPEIRWGAPRYANIQMVLTNPTYAGAYVYGRRQTRSYVDENGRIRKRTISVPRDQWLVVIRDHHKGYIDWDTYEANQSRLSQNAPRRPKSVGGGAVREGSALLQGIAVCGICGRRLSVRYVGRTSTPVYNCEGTSIANSRSA